MRGLLCGPAGLGKTDLMRGNGAIKMSGDLGLKVVPGDFGSPAMREVSLPEMMRLGLPQRGLSDEVNRWRIANFRNWLRGVRDVRRALKCRAPTLVGTLYLAHIRPGRGRLDLGLAGARVVTDAFVEELVDRLVAAGNINGFNFHGIGTGAAAEAGTDTALGTEITTEYETNNTRPSGTQVEGASANIYRTVGTVTVDASVAATEHGVFNNATVGSGILMDRTVFSVVNLANGDSLQATYELTLPSGS